VLAGESDDSDDFLSRHWKNDAIRPPYLRRSVVFIEHQVFRVVQDAVWPEEIL
jgi:uncharacterized protein (DUF2267 family)